MLDVRVVTKKLKHELTQDKGASFALAWAFTWRIVLVFLLISIPLDFARRALDSNYLGYFAALEILVAILLMWLIIHHVLRRGVGRVKIIIMEESHYNDLVDKTSEEKQL